MSTDDVKVAEETNKRTIDDVENTEESEAKRAKKVPKQKVVLAIGYEGTNYHGSQSQAHTANVVNSVEDELFAAIIKAGGVSEQNKDMKKVAWHRCSRTDKGVHAILNLISLKMLMEPDIVNKINQHLPRDIHLYGYKRVIASFNPKIMCNARRYDYLIPTFALKPDVRREEPENPDLLTVDQLKESTLDFSYRVDTPTLEKFRNLLSKYVGTKSFRNFTTKQKVNQSIDTQRYIIEYKCSDPIIIDGVEVVVATVHGASFIYNQIRKMIGFALCVIRGIIPEEEFDSALNAKYSCRVPTAPGDGLMLDLLYFDGYNKRHGGVHGNLEFSEYEEQMKKFKVQVFEGIVRLEKEKQELARWLYRVRSHKTDTRSLTEEELAAETKKGKKKNTEEED